MFYVYVHRDMNNNIFYIGKASDKYRARSKRGRNKAWFEISKNGYSIQYIETLSEEEAIELEEFLISEIPNLTNIKKSEVILDYSSVDWSSFLYYDESSPTFLRYKIDNKCRNPKYKKYAGDVAGYTRIVNGKKGHSKIEHKGKTYSVHRVIWTMLVGQIEKGMVINHIDCDMSNNLLSNLEVCTKSQNMNRTSIQVLGKTKSNCGISNIIFKYDNEKLKGIRCKILFNKKCYTKYFSVDKYGFDVALLLALEHLSVFKKNAQEN